MDEMLSIAAPRMSADQIQGKKKSNRCKNQDSQNKILPTSNRLPFSDTFEPTSPLPTQERKKKGRNML